MDQVNYTAQKAWKALHFVMRVLKTGNKNTKSLAYTSLVRPVLGCGSACWDPCRKGQINALDRVRKELLNLQIVRRILTGKPWLSVGRQHAYAHFLNRTVGLGKLHATSCEGFTIRVGLIMFGKLGTGNKERISGSIPL